MNRTERVLLLAWFVAVLAVLFTRTPDFFAAVGTAGGVVLGLPVARSRLLRGRPGTGLERRRGVSLQRVGTTVAAHLVVLVALVLVAAVVPGLRGGFVGMVGAAATAGAATVTAARLRRQA